MLLLHIFRSKTFISETTRSTCLERHGIPEALADKIFAADIQLIARQGGNGQYAIRPRLSNLHFSNQKTPAHPFNLLARLRDYRDGYRDHRYSEREAQAITLSFARKPEANIFAN